MHVVIVVGDMGGANECIPVGLLLASSGHFVEWIVCPSKFARAQVKLDEAKIAYERRLPEEGDAVADMILIGVSATAVDAQKAFTAFGKARNISVIWLEDLFGTGSIKAVSECSPDLMLVISEVAATLARTVRPGLEVKVVGKPSFGKLIPKFYTGSSLRRKLISTCHLPSDVLIVACVLSGEHVLEQVRVLMRTPSPVGYPQVALILRLHPKLSGEIKDEAMQIMATAQNLLIKTAPELTTDEVVIASDLVISGHSATEQYVGLLASVPALITMFPGEEACREELRNRGCIDRKSPLVSMGGAIELCSELDYQNIIPLALTNQALRQDLLAVAPLFASMIDSAATRKAVQVIEERYMLQPV